MAIRLKDRSRATASARPQAPAGLLPTDLKDLIVGIDSRRIARARQQTAGSRSPMKCHRPRSRLR